MTIATSWAIWAGAKYPLESKVAFGEPTYGDPINVLNGTLMVGGTDPNYPGESLVILGTLYGTTGTEEFTGNNRQADQVDVLAGRRYGPNDALIGLLDVGGGIGSTTITFRAQQAVTGNALENVKHELLDTTRVFWTFTDGNVEQNLDPGNYTLRVTAPPGYDTVPDRTVNVGNANDTIVTTLTLATPGPVDPSGQTIQVRCQVSLNAVPINGAIVSATLNQQTSAVNTDQTVPSTYKSEGVTVNGYVDLYLYRKGQFTSGDGRYAISAVHNKKTIWSVVTSLPDEDFVYLAALQQEPLP